MEFKYEKASNFSTRERKKIKFDSLEELTNYVKLKTTSISPQEKIRFYWGAIISYDIDSNCFILMDYDDYIE